MKVLLYKKQTAGIISLSSSESYYMQHQVQVKPTATKTLSLCTYMFPFI